MNVGAAGDIELLGEVLRRSVSDVPIFSGFKAPRENASEEEVLAQFHNFPLTDKSLLR